MKEKIFKYIESNKKWFIDKLIDLITINTVNNVSFGNENNGQIIIEDIFKTIGLNIDRFSPDEIESLKTHKAFLSGRNYKERDNIVGFIGDGKKKKLIFSGHIDTVQTKESDWSYTKPFSPKIIGNKLFGLGSLDMKGGLLSSIFALKSLIDLGVNIKGQVILESVVDEEFGGANGTLACIERGYEGDFAIIPEPTNMQIFSVLMDQKIFNISLKGKSGINIDDTYSESPNALLLANRLINILMDYEAYLNSKKNNHVLFNNYKKPVNFIIKSITAGEIGKKKLFTAPSNCQMEICIRNYPNHDEYEFDKILFDYLKKDLVIKKGINTKSIIFSKIGRYMPRSNYKFNSKVNKVFINRLIENGKSVTQKDIKVIGGNYAGDLFIFNNHSNTTAMCFGPGGANAHSPDEYVFISDLINLSKIFASTIYGYCC